MRRHVTIGLIGDHNDSVPAHRAIPLALQMAAETLGITATRLKSLGLIDKVVSEPLGGAQRNPEAMMQTLKKALNDALRALVDKPRDGLLAARYERLMSYGKFKEAAV